MADNDFRVKRGIVVGTDAYISNSITSVNTISFNTNGYSGGELRWNSSDGTLDVYTGYGDVVLQTGQETHYVVRNATSSTIVNGTALYCSGVTGGSGRIEVSPMIGDGSISPVQFLGLATHNITNGVNGVVTYFGYVRDLDTRGTANTAISVGDETWAVGDKLYVHPTVPGKLTKVEPEAPNTKICVASITTRNQTTGALFVRPTTNLTLDKLSDVQINNLVNGDVLTYVSANSRFENKTISSNSFTTISVSGQSNVVADSSSDTITFAAGAGIQLSTDPSTDTITITNTGGSSGAGLIAGDYVVRAAKSGTDQTITGGSDTVVTFTDDFDPQNWFGSNKFQPTVAGYYSIATQIWWVAGSVTNNQNNIQFRKNGNIQIGIAQDQIVTGSGYTQVLSTIAYFNGSSDYVEITAYTGNPTSQDIVGSSSGTYFTAALYAYGDAANTWVNANDYATLLSARSNDYNTLLTAYSNDYATLLSARSNDYNTLLSAYSNDYATLLSAQSNDGATLLTARSNDYNTLLSAYSNDLSTLNTARANDYNSYSTIVGLINTVQDNVSSSSSNTNIIAGNSNISNTTVFIEAGDGVLLSTNTTSKTLTIATSMSNVTSQTISISGTANSFTLTKAAANSNMVLVMYNGLVQDPSRYIISGSTLTLANIAPLIAGANIEVRYFDFFSLPGTTSSGGGGASFQGSVSGYTSGGATGSATNIIDKFPFASNANASDVGDLTQTRLFATAGQSSSASGYTSGGLVTSPAVDNTNVIDKFPFATNANASDVGDLTFGRYFTAGQSSSTSGYTSGGANRVTAAGTIIDKFSFAANGNATDVGDLTQGRHRIASHSSSVSGYNSGGSAGGGAFNTVDKFTFAADGNATDVGDLINSITEGAGQSSSTSGYTSGGTTGGGVLLNVIQKFPFASNTNAADVGDLTQSRYAAAGQSSTTSGYTSGGSTSALNTVDKFSFAVDSNATDVGDLTQGRYSPAGQQV